MQHVDGNSLAGPLAEVFAFEVTTASARCAGCGTVELLAAAMVYRDAMGTVARCAHCDDVLLTIVEAKGRTWVTMPGMTALALSPVK